MTTEGHIAALERRHRELDRQIDDEMSHLAHDDMVIAALKRKKLEIKDELAKLNSRAACDEASERSNGPGSSPGLFIFSRSPESGRAEEYAADAVPENLDAQQQHEDVGEVIERLYRDAADEEHAERDANQPQWDQCR